MIKCVFCGHDAMPTQGVHLITNDGNVQYFCSSKCRKNALKLKRDKRRLKWTEAYRVALAKTRAAAVRDAKLVEEKQAMPAQTKKK